MSRRADRRPHGARNAASADSRNRHSKRDRITPFERRILQLLAVGMHRSEIAEELDRSPQTISNVLTIAKDKLGARTLAEAAALVAEDEEERGG